MKDAQRCAGAIICAFDRFHAQFRAVTRRAAQRFAERDWHGMQRAAVERLDIREEVVRSAVAEIRELLGQRVQDKCIWQEIKSAYVPLVVDRLDRELAETFFNSVTRRIFTTVGVDPVIEFLDHPASFPGLSHVCRLYAAPAIDADLISMILRDSGLALPERTVERDAEVIAERVNAFLSKHVISNEIDSVEVVRQIFYRNKGAYIVGRICCDGRYVPLVLAILHEPDGMFVDAVLMDEADIRVVFSFARSSFHVETDQPRALVAFLRSLMPGKPVAELYAAIGYFKHAKTERYRALQAHLRRSSDQFRIAPGEKGMVMVVFDLPSLDLVFKVIRDRFAYPKTTTRKDVLDRYHLVFKHDRGGRLVDTQEFEYLAFERARFNEELLDELRREAASSVEIDDRRVVIKHLYIERRLTPLNLYLQTASVEDACAVVRDYGQAIRDLAATNIYPGDISLKNFGVTRRGRVVFYDYDELCLLSECNVRALPQARNDAEEWAAEPWFFVGERDLFPEEFRTFLGLHGPLRQIFTEAHGDLFTVAFWKGMQERHAAGEIIDLFHMATTCA